LPASRAEEAGEPYFKEDIMNTFDPENIIRESDANDLGDKIVKALEKFGHTIDITQCWMPPGRIIFHIKMKGKTRWEQVRKCLPDVEDRVKQKLDVYKREHRFYLVSTDPQITYDHLPVLLGKAEVQERIGKCTLPWIVGYNFMGFPIVIDLAKVPHLLIGGSSSSGKTVGIKSLITCLAMRSPAHINFIIIDVGTTDLTVFEELPHNACPIVRDRDTAYLVLAALRAEMERRIKLEVANPRAFKALPHLVLVIDEFPALFMGMDSKMMSKAISETISSLLQRGRHAKIHVILAAQNPTIQNMKVDLGNITTRIAFRCAKKNFSEVILGEGGAENLSGPGALLLKAPIYDSPQQLQGVFITPKEVRQLVQRIRKSLYPVTTNKFVLPIPEKRLLPTALSAVADNTSPTADELLLAQVVAWAVEKEEISANLLMNNFKVGWNRATRYMRRLEDWNLVDRPDGKQARRVHFTSTDNFPEDLLMFMERCGLRINESDLETDKGK